MTPARWTGSYRNAAALAGRVRPERPWWAAALAPHSLYLHLANTAALDLIRYQGDGYEEPNTAPRILGGPACRVRSTVTTRLSGSSPERWASLGSEPSSSRPPGGAK